VRRRLAGAKVAAVLVVGVPGGSPSSSCCLRLDQLSECRRPQHDDGNETKLRVEEETKRLDGVGDQLG
jgi:hypothetical protein